MIAAQRSGQSAVLAIFARYRRPCPFSAELLALLDGMLQIDPARRLSFEQLIAMPFCSADYAPHLTAEPTFRTPLLNRRRATENWQRVTGAARGLGRALLSFRSVFDTVRS